VKAASPPPGPRRIRLAKEGWFLAVPSLDAAAVSKILEAHRETRDPARILKRNLGTIVSRVRLEGGALPAAGGVPAELVVKEVPVRGPRRLFYALGGASAFRKEFDAASRLERLSIHSPRPVACTYRPGPGAARHSEFLISEMVQGSVPLHDLLWLGGSVLTDPDELRALLERVGTWLRHVHDQGVWQRDMKPSNVLLRGEDFFLVDITALKVLPRPLDDLRRVRNLAQLLDLTRAHDSVARQPLLTAYSRAGAVDIARWASKVDAAIEERRDYRERQCGFRYVDEEHRLNQERLLE
jgi:tRNA A-37 threonylcarbamoyl transferase component Bud32